MIYGIELQLAERNSQRQQATANDIISFLSQFEQFLYPAGTTATQCVGTFNGAYKWGSDWTFAVAGEARLTDQATRDSMWTQLDSLIGTGNQGPVIGSARAGHARRYDIGVDQDPPDYSQTNVQVRTF